MARLYLRNFCTRSYPLLRHKCPRKIQYVAVPDTWQYLKSPLITCSTSAVQQYQFTFRSYTNKAEQSPQNCNSEPQEKKSLLKRFKEMYRDYWYVLVPVHLVTSAAWFGGFYYAAKSGVDIVGILESLNVSQRITNTVKDSSMGYLAVSYALYKLATPFRYTVTLGGTTISIKYLKELGYIKPVPSRTQLKEMYKEKRENIIESIKESRDFYKHKKDSIKSNCERIKIKDKKDNDDVLFKELKTRLGEIKKVKIDLENKQKQMIDIEKKEN